MTDTRRDTWDFLYTAPELLSATTAKVAHHTERLAHWTAERDRREETLRTSGIDIRAGVRTGGTHTSYYGQPTFDADLLQAFTEAQERVSVHEKARDDFTRWERIFRHEHERPNSAASFSLTAQDVAFFGL